MMATKAREAMLEKLSLRLRILLFFAALALGGVGAVIAGLWFGYRKIGDPALLNGFVLAGSIASFVILGLVTWVWYLFDENVGPKPQTARPVTGRPEPQLPPGGSMPQPGLG